MRPQQHEDYISDDVVQTPPKLKLLVQAMSEGRKASQPSASRFRRLWTEQEGKGLRRLTKV